MTEEIELLCKLAGIKIVNRQGYRALSKCNVYGEEFMIYIRCDDSEKAYREAIERLIEDAKIWCVDGSWI